MPAPENRFKRRLTAGELQIGLWLGLCSPLAAELCARRGFGWLVIDGEHAPNDLGSTLAQLQAIAATEAQAVVRVPIGEAWMIKQVLDLGAQTILVPMVETVADAAALVRAVRYPPRGVRGVGAALARASHFNAIGDYLTSADDEVCLILQVESRKGVANAAAISALDGVDGVFVGPADLAADMGHLGDPGVAAVQEAVEGAIRAIRKAGAGAGVLTSDMAIAERYIGAGANFVAVGSDIGLLGSAAGALCARFDSGTTG
jgi:4-hydroxy-2-oxoheptanedioate aldolase